MRYHDKLDVPSSRMAREARRWFKYIYQEPNPDFKDAPSLPVTPQEHFWLRNMKDGPFGYLIERYATSLKANRYIYGHPLPDEFLRGLMACSALPEEVRRDPEMLRRFPPKDLEGLDQATMVWSPGESDGKEAA